MESPFKPGMRYREAQVIRDGKKWCNGCQDWVVIEDYARDAHARNGYRSKCKKCYSADARKWWADNPKKRKLRAKQQNNWRKRKQVRARLDGVALTDIGKAVMERDD